MNEQRFVCRSIEAIYDIRRQFHVTDYLCTDFLNLTSMEPCIARCVFYITNEIQLL